MASPKPPPVQRAISFPESPARDRIRQQVEYSQSERLTRDRPVLARSTSRKEAIKNFIKKETASFFGVDEDSEEGQQQRWLDRRKRLASRYVKKFFLLFMILYEQKMPTLSLLVRLLRAFRTKT